MNDASLFTDHDTATECPGILTKSLSLSLTLFSVTVSQSYTSDAILMVAKGAAVNTTTALESKLQSHSVPYQIPLRNAMSMPARLLLAKLLVYMKTTSSKTSFFTWLILLAVEI